MLSMGSKKLIVIICFIAIAAIFFFSKRPKFVDVEIVRVEKRRGKGNRFQYSRRNC
jgi:hypothetical protein